MRKHLAWYIKGLHGASAMRDRINQTDNVKMLVDMLEKYRVELHADGITDDGIKQRF